MWVWDDCWLCGPATNRNQAPDLGLHLSVPSSWNNGSLGREWGMPEDTLIDTTSNWWGFNKTTCTDRVAINHSIKPACLSAVVFRINTTGKDMYLLCYGILPTPAINSYWSLVYELKFAVNAAYSIQTATPKYSLSYTVHSMCIVQIVIDRIHVWLNSHSVYIVDTESYRDHCVCLHISGLPQG